MFLLTTFAWLLRLLFVVYILGIESILVFFGYLLGRAGLIILNDFENNFG
jgi:hypothetical protein